MEEDNPRRTIQAFKEFLQEEEERKKEEEERNSVHAHYGIKESELKEMIGELVKQMLIKDKVNEVLDAQFPTLDAEGRMKVHAYYVAREHLDRMTRRK